MELQWQSNMIIARMNLTLRRIDRCNADLNSQYLSDLKYRRWSYVSGLFADYAIYACELLWGFITPIMSMIFWIIFRAVLMVLIGMLLFYVLLRLLVH